MYTLYIVSAKCATLTHVGVVVGGATEAGGRSDYRGPAGRCEGCQGEREGSAGCLEQPQISCESDFHCHNINTVYSKCI